MKKRFLSLLLTAALVVGLIPAMTAAPVLAAGGTDFFADNFENYNVGTKVVGSSSEAPLTDKSGVEKFRLREALTAEIVSEIGYDGKITQCLRVDVPTRTTDNSAGRMYSASHTSSKFTGKYVYEFKIKGTATYITFNPFKLDSEDAAYKFNGTTIGYKSLWPDWASVRIVVDAATDKFLVYMNDVLVSYNEGTCDLDQFKNAYFNFKYSNSGTYLYIDDIRLYHTPDATVATAAQKDATDVALTAKPTVTFTEALLDTTANSDATVTITDKTNGGSTVAPFSVAADGKSLTITPEGGLAYGTEYEIALNNFRDIYDAAITGDTTFTLTTMEEPKYAATEPVFKKHQLFDGTSSVITELENGAISCEYSITNNEDEAKPVCFLVVLYENNELKQFQFKNEQVASGATATFSGGFTVGDAANTRIQTFIWNSLSGMGALSPSYTFTTSGMNN